MIGINSGLDACQSSKTPSGASFGCQSRQKINYQRNPGTTHLVVAHLAAGASGCVMPMNGFSVDIRRVHMVVINQLNEKIGPHHLAGVLDFSQLHEFREPTSHRRAAHSASRSPGKLGGGPSKLLNVFDILSPEAFASLGNNGNCIHLCIMPCHLPAGRTVVITERQKFAGAMTPSGLKFFHKVVDLHPTQFCMLANGLSRNELAEALERFLSVLRSGIKIFLLADGHEYTNR